MSPEMMLSFFVGIFIGIILFSILYLVFKISMVKSSVVLFILGAIIVLCSMVSGFAGMIYGSGGIGLVIIGIVILICGLFEQIRVLKKKKSDDERRTY